MEGMDGLKAIPYVVLVLVVAGIIVGAGVMVTTSFKDTITACDTPTGHTVHHFNATLGYCISAVNNTNTSNATIPYQTLLDSTEAQLTVGEQLPTLAIIAIMVVIIAVIAGVFAYFKYFG